LLRTFYCSQVRIKNLQPARKLYYVSHRLILQGIQEVRTLDERTERVARELIAKRIIRMAQSGEVDPEF